MEKLSYILGRTHQVPQKLQLFFSSCASFYRREVKTKLEELKLKDY